MTLGRLVRPVRSGVLDFAGEPLTLFQKDYAGAPWNGTASASTSGSFNLVAGSAPSVGTNFGTHPSADFNGTLNYLAGSGTAGDLFTVSAWYFAAAVSIDVYAADQVGAEYNQDAIITENSGTLGVTVSTSGLQVFQYDSIVGKVATAYVAMPAAGTKTFVEGWYDGTNIYCAVNGSTSAGAAVGNLDAGVTATTPQVGANYDGSALTDGKFGLLIARKTVPNSLTRAAYLAAAQAGYGVP